MDPFAQSAPLDWLAVPANWQGLVLAVIAAICLSAANLLDRQAGFATVLAGIVLSVLLTVIAIPFAVLSLHLSWPWWSLIGVAMGVASLRVRRGLDALAEKLEQRLPDAAADRVTDIVGGRHHSNQEPGDH